MTQAGKCTCKHLLQVAGFQTLLTLPVISQLSWALVSSHPCCTSVLLNESNQSQHENLISSILALVTFSAVYLVFACRSPQTLSASKAPVFASTDVYQPQITLSGGGIQKSDQVSQFRGLMEARPQPEKISISWPSFSTLKIHVSEVKRSLDKSVEFKASNFSMVVLNDDVF